MSKPTEKKKAQQFARYTGKEYEFTREGILWWRPFSANNQITSRQAVKLCNFTAEIVAELLEDDGAEQTLTFEIAIAIGARHKTITVPARDFDAMNWITPQLGARANIYPGMKEQVRAAIKILSTKIVERACYKHMGWRKLDEQTVYLHAGGAIGAKGAQPLTVKLHHALTHFELPRPGKKADLRRAVKASMKMLDIAPDRITFPVYACIWRAILGDAPFSVHLSGLTGTGKSQIAALVQQHYGAKMNADHLPASWSSTANAIEELGFEAKNAVLTVDDFIPVGSPADIQRLHKDADRLLRAQGNQSGRIRMNADLSVRAARPPRGMFLSTGEDVPGGQSLRARLIIVEMSPGDLNFKALTPCQQDAAEGRYALATAGYIKWLAPRIGNAAKAMQQALIDFRQTSEKIAGHRRTPDNICNLMQGVYFFLQYATAIHAVTHKERAKLWTRAVKALHDLIEFQSSNQTTTDPTQQFVQLTASALSGGRAHLVNAQGGAPPPEQAPRCGWIREGKDWRPTGQKIGWTAGADIYLDPNNAFAVAQQLGKESSQSIPLALSTLQRRLKQAGLLASTDEARQTVTVRRTFEGSGRAVLHLWAGTLYPATEPDKPDIGKLELIRPPAETAFLTDKPDILELDPTTPKPIQTASKTPNVGFVGFPKGMRGRVDLRPKTPKPGKKQNPTKLSGLSTEIVKNVLNKYHLTYQFIRPLYDVGAGFIAQLVTKCKAVIPEIRDEDIAHVARECYLRDKNKQTSAGLFLSTIPSELYRLQAKYNLNQQTAAPKLTKAEQRRRDAEIAREAKKYDEYMAREKTLTMCPKCHLKRLDPAGYCDSRFCIEAAEKLKQKKG